MSQPRKNLAGSLGKLPQHTSRSISITTWIFIGLGLVGALIAAIVIARSFEGYGLPVAIAVVGGTLGVFTLSVGGRLLADELTRAIHKARGDHPDARSGEG